LPRCGCSLFKQSIKFFFGVRRLCAGLSNACLEAEGVAEIGAAFIQNPFGLRLAAIVIDAAFIKKAVEAAVKIGSAVRALSLSADKQIIRNFFFAILAGFHGPKNTGNAQCLSSDFLKFVRLIKFHVI